jgi:UPF0042 nucleotide-binding protein
VNSGKNELLLVTGMSGAGRSTIAHALEDIGWYVVDNLPPSMLPSLVQTASSSQTSVAVVIDVRGRHFFSDLESSLEAIKSQGITSRILFVDSLDDVLVRRFESTRRPHPLQGSDRIIDGIAREREALKDVRSLAEIIIDSSSLNVHQLTQRISDLLDPAHASTLRVNILSFGYKYGVPVDADLVMDCRFIPNPHWIPELRPLTGLDPSVSKNVLGADNVSEFLNNYEALFQTISRGFFHEGRKYLTLAVGCTGGKHRSVAIAEELKSRFDGLNISEGQKIVANAIHRDLGKEL